METIRLKLSFTYCLLQTLFGVVCAWAVCTKGSQAQRRETSFRRAPLLRNQIRGPRRSPANVSRCQSISPKQQCRPSVHTQGQEYGPSSQWHPCFSTPEQGARCPSPSGTASTCHRSALTSVLPSDPRYRSKRHSRSKHHGEGGEQPPSRGTHPHRSGLQQGLQQQMLAGSGAHSRGRGGGHSELQHSPELVGGTNPEAPHFSALTLGEVSANVKGHQVLKRRAALRPSEEILEESAKERMQVRMCGNNACFLFSQHHRPRPYPPPTAPLSPQPQPRTLLQRNRVVRRKGPPAGDSPTQTLHPRRHYSQGFLLLRLAWNAGQTQGPDQQGKHMPGCPASSLCGHRVQLVK